SVTENLAGTSVVRLAARLAVKPSAASETNEMSVTISRFLRSIIFLLWLNLACKPRFVGVPPGLRLPVKAADDRWNAALYVSDGVMSPAPPLHPLQVPRSMMTPARQRPPGHVPHFNLPSSTSFSRLRTLMVCSDTTTSLKPDLARTASRPSRPSRMM